jgi:TonB-dependent receptor
MKRMLVLSTGLATVWASSALAQSISSPDSTTTTPTGAAAAAARKQSAKGPAGDEVLVTGIRRANNAAVEAKRASTNIIDAVGSNEVRALPDNTVVEALRRIPGLTVFPTNDNEHTQDEAVTPVIRGLGPAYNNVTIDGLAVASPGTPNGAIGSIQRGVRLDILPTSMISQLQVVKTFTADLDPNAVGGAINIVTRSAFEGKGQPFFTIEGALGHSTDVGVPRSQSDPGGRFVFTASDTFGPDHIFGYTLSGNYEALSNYTEEHATIDSTYYNFYDNTGKLQTGAALGNGIPVPQQDRYWYAQNARTRKGVTAKLEARPNDQLEAYISAGYYDFKTHYQRNEVDLDAHNYGAVQNQTNPAG